MVSIDPATMNNRPGVFVPRKWFILTVLSTMTLLLLQLRATFLMPASTTARSTSTLSLPTVSSNSIHALRHHHSSSSSSSYNNNNDQCALFLAESAIPFGGLGIFTGIGLHKGDRIGYPDICIYVNDMKAPERQWMQMRTHTWGKGNFFGQHEGQTSRAACEGIVTTFNTMPGHMINTKIISPSMPTNAGLHRKSSPGAGAITHHYGIHAEALDVVRAGSELTIDYGDWDFDDNKEYTKPERPVEWLREHGWCIDNIEIRPATDPQMGRGAFTTRSLSAGAVVAPAPLQSFRDRSVFDNDPNEQLYVNYCFQAPGTKMIFFPYGQGVNLINHSKEKQNVYLRWSENPLHHAAWLDMSLEEYWKVSKPGGIVLEVVALRDLAEGEELFLDYGDDWEDAWNAHVEKWSPLEGAQSHVYPADMDETLPLRTVEEQKTDPYPDNLAFMCHTPDWSSRKQQRNITWYESGWYWWEGLTYCHILEREKGPTGDDVYTVQLVFRSSRDGLVFDETKDRKEMYIDEQVPRRAIRFVEKPYADDEHLPNAFRHPIGLPAELFPTQWLDNESTE